MISGTIADASGRTLIRADHRSVSLFIAPRRSALTSGLNCALGPDELRQYVQELSRIANRAPERRLPNAFRSTISTPTRWQTEFVNGRKPGFLNIVGRCHTPRHLAAMSRAVEGLAPRKLPEIPVACRLSA
ncbi:homocysteine S-methyltransferase family protein [Shigella flexneri]